MNSLILVVAACLLLIGLCQSQPYNPYDIVVDHPDPKVKDIANDAIVANAAAYTALGDASNAAASAAATKLAAANYFANSLGEFEESAAVESAVESVAAELKEFGD